MKERQLEKEFALLDSIINGDKVEHVQLLNFSNDVQEQNFLIENEDWSALRQTLSESFYDGGTIFEKLNTITKRGRVFVFTDGNKLFKEDFLSLDEGDVLVNSSVNADHKTLKLWEYLSRATLFDYTDSAIGAEKIDENKFVSGFVYLDGKPITNVLVQSSSGEAMKTNEDGAFKYKGRKGDTLRITGGSNYNKTLVIDDPTDEIKFFLDSKTVVLDEVVVSEERLEKLNIKNLGYLSMEQKKIGFAVYEIPEERISAIETNMTNVLQEVPGLFIGALDSWDPRNSGLSTANVRGKSSFFIDNKVLVVIDGTPIQKSRNNFGEQNADYSFIDPQNIKSIKVLKGLAATNLYGSEGGGGVILITSKTGSGNKYSNGKPVDQARLTNNIFEGKLTSKKGQLLTPYIKELRNAKNIRDAYDTYLIQRNKYQNDVQYFIDVSDYFRTGSPQLADRILSNIIEKETNYKSLRKLYLKYKFLGDDEMGLIVAEKMFDNYPKVIQPYYDLAVSLIASEKIQSAVDLLNGIVTGNLDKTLDFSPLNKIAGATLRNLVNRHKSKLDLSKIDISYKNNLTYNARLIFDWENPQNEFVLKFVNPQNRFFDWEHSTSGDKQRITKELKNGFTIEQFELVDDISIGNWQVNVTNLNVENNKEVYLLKCTVQYNFGKSNQRQEEHLIRLDPSDSKEQLFFKLKVE